MKLFCCCLFILFSACAPQSYFKDPNDVNKKKVVLYLRNKPEMAGILTIPYEEDFNRAPTIPNILRFTPEGKDQEEKIDLKEVVGYSIDTTYYALKRLYLFTHNTYHLLFAKRLTHEDSRIQLYELFESGKGNSTGESQYSYYISFPTYSRYETLNTHSVKLIPEFNEKMSLLIPDCPSLAQKIRNKDNGYYIPLVTVYTYKHREVMIKIINEYNNCK